MTQKHGHSCLKVTGLRLQVIQVFSKNEVDFGSRTLIDAFEAPEIEGDYLDLGCGYGPIGLSLAKADRTRVCHLVDVNERAIALAKENARVNQVDNVNIYSSDRFENVNQAFAAILTNPPIRAGKQTVHLMLEESLIICCLVARCGCHSKETRRTVSNEKA